MRSIGSMAKLLPYCLKQSAIALNASRGRPYFAAFVGAMADNMTVFNRKPAS